MDILFFGKLGATIGRQIRIEAPAGSCTVGELRALLATQYPHATEDLASPSLKAFVDDSLVAEDIQIEAGGRVEFLPPLSGG